MHDPTPRQRLADRLAVASTFGLFLVAIVLIWAAQR